MTAKAGQKCTAVRRALVPRAHLDAAADALRTALAQVVVGDPRDPATGMGALVSPAQRDAVRTAVARLAEGGQVVAGDPEADLPGLERGAFLSPVLVLHRDPAAPAVHEVEAFGPVASLLPVRRRAARRRPAGPRPRQPGGVRRQRGSRPSSARWCSAPPPSHGRVHVLDRHCARESTGHGSPLPHLVHGGPGRAGGGEELGGLRGVRHHMQRTAVQGTPDVLTAVTGVFTPGATRVESDVHPFRKTMGELQVGDTFTSPYREVTAEDVAQFAEFTGDRFYAHTDPVAAAENPLFGGIVAHGYLVLSFAAGLFVEPAPGPVLANTGLDRLRFTRPVKPGDAVRAVLTCAARTPRTADQGEVRWDVQVQDRDGGVVAAYELLTMVRA